MKIVLIILFGIQAYPILRAKNKPNFDWFYPPNLILCNTINLSLDSVKKEISRNLKCRTPISDYENMNIGSSSRDVRGELQNPENEKNKEFWKRCSGRWMDCMDSNHQNLDQNVEPRRYSGETSSLNEKWNKNRLLSSKRKPLTDTFTDFDRFCSSNLKDKQNYIKHAWPFFLSPSQLRVPRGPNATIGPSCTTSAVAFKISAPKQRWIDSTIILKPELHLIDVLAQKRRVHANDSELRTTYALPCDHCEVVT